MLLDGRYQWMIGTESLLLHLISAHVGVDFYAEDLISTITWRHWLWVHDHGMCPVSPIHPLQSSRLILHHSCFLTLLQLCYITSLFLSFSFLSSIFLSFMSKCHDVLVYTVMPSGPYYYYYYYKIAWHSNVVATVWRRCSCLVWGIFALVALVVYTAVIYVSVYALL